MNMFRVALQVIGYITGLGMLSSTQVTNMQRASSAIGEQVNNWAVPLPPNISASAIFASVNQWHTTRNDHMMSTFGRNNQHSSNIYLNNMYSTAGYYNDLQITLNGDASSNTASAYDYFGLKPLIEINVVNMLIGYAHGTQMIPLTNNAFSMYNQLYKDDSTTPTQLNIQVRPLSISSISASPGPFRCMASSHCPSTPTLCSCQQPLSPGMPHVTFH